MHGPTVAWASFDRVEELGEATDLVIVEAMRKLEQLSTKVAKPGGPLWQMNLAGLDAGGLGAIREGQTLSKGHYAIDKTDTLPRE